MDNSRKKELAREFKERKRQQGIFAVVCEATGERWVASSPNLDKLQNRLWFELRNGGHSNKPMQAAWTAHGEASFRYEIVEEIDDENPLLIASLMKDREVHWRTKLGAAAVFN